MIDLMRSFCVAVGVAACLGGTPSAVGQSHEAFTPAEPGGDPSGMGWSGPWATSAHLGSAATLNVSAEASLPTPVGLTPGPTGGRLVDFTGLAFRGLGIGQEFDLEAPESWYLRVAVRRSAVGDEAKSRGVSLLLHDGLDRKLTLGCSSSGKLSISGGADAVSPKPIMSLDHAYVWLIRLDATDAEGLRSVYFTSFHESQSFPESEPADWLLVSEPALLIGTIDRIGIAVGRNVHAEFDELRIARSWDELTGQ